MLTRTSANRSASAAAEARVASPSDGGVEGSARQADSRIRADRRAALVRIGSLACQACAPTTSTREPEASHARPLDALSGSQPAPRTAVSRRTTAESSSASPNS